MKLDTYMPVRLVSGSGCVNANASLFEGKRCLIVTGGSSAQKSGALDDVKNALESQGKEYTVFSQINENPLVSSCILAAEQARDFKADFIVGIGGGSPLDASKAVAIFAKDASLTEESIYKRKVPAPALPVYLVGTTAGTGSEVTGVAVLTRSAGNKQSISGADCYARAAFLDARYTYTMPYSVTVSTALDALAHAAEGWFSSKLSDLAKGYASLALPDIYTGLRKLLQSGELSGEQDRERMYYASIYAGLELNICGAAFPHTVGYVLSEDYGITHGKACTAFMPLLIKRARQFCPDRVKELFKLLDTDEDSFIDVVKSLTDVTLQTEPEKAREYCGRWTAQSKNFVNSPGGFTPEDAYAALTGGI